MRRFVFAFTLLLAAVPALAQPQRGQPQPARVPPGTIPTADAAGIRDSAALPRYAGSVLLGGSQSAFDEVVFANAALRRVPERRDVRNNAVNLPPDPIRAEGRRTRLVYLIPEGRSPLEVIRGYQQVITTANGQRVFECSEAECGGDNRRGATSGGGETGILNMMMPAAEVPQSPGNPVGCAVDVNRGGQRYALMALPNNGGFAAVLSYVVGDVSAGSDCQRWVGRTVAVVNIIETAAREQRMEVVSATGMGAALEREGRVALYAIQFDTGRAEIKPESEAQLAAMADFLRANAGIRVLIVGHTDNQGGLDMNLDLSRRRAASVVAALTQRGIAGGRMVGQGVGMAAPLATNDTDEGRARNRRVELVKQ